VFYLHYLISELRRRPGRTALTALGLAVGVGLVVIVGALSQGLDDAQGKVLAPLTGVGTDLSVTRPVTVPQSGSGAGVFAGLSPRERRELRRETAQHTETENFIKSLNPGQRFSRATFSSTDLSLPQSLVAKIGGLDGAAAAAGTQSLNELDVHGKVPASGTFQEAPGGVPPPSVKISQLSVAGIDARTPRLAPVEPDQITRGRYLSRDPSKARDEAIVDLGYASQNKIGVGDELSVGGAKLKVVGLAKAPLGGDASNAYVDLGRLQELSDRRGWVNRILVRADSPGAVVALAQEIKRQIPGAEVVTASVLADRVGGSLENAKNLSSKLGTALAIVALLAAFLIAAMLTLSSVQKRIRELGTLKALGWSKRLVVRQVAGESLVQGALGGLVGAAIGIAGAAIIAAIGPTVVASVAQPASTGSEHFAPGSAITAGSTKVVLGAPVSAELVALAVGLAVLGGLLAGAAGGLRAARLRPAEALRSAE
jgi:putative ABC transport system permease protein